MCNPPLATLYLIAAHPVLAVEGRTLCWHVFTTRFSSLIVAFTCR
jgi:hypothetical protein